MYLSILKKAVPVPKLLNFDSYLFFGPHPDDIEVACGGTVARLAQAGKKITFVIATNGCVGGIDETLSAQQLIEVRQKEARASAKLLGVDDVIFLPYNDGADYDKDAMLRDFVKLIVDVQPQVVLCPDYAVPSECHPDHLNVGRLATEAVFYASWEKITSRFGIKGVCKNVTLAYYYTHKPNAYVGVRKTRKLHMQAIRAHVSQFTQTDFESLEKYMTLRQLRFGARSGKGRAEGFRVLNPTMQHCFPEASEY